MPSRKSALTLTERALIFQATQYARRDDAVNQVVPVLEQYKGQLYHESTDFSERSLPEQSTEPQLIAMHLQHTMMGEWSCSYS